MTSESPASQEAVPPVSDAVPCCTDDFVNEHGNRIVMSLEVSEQEVTVRASGPSSTLDHTWTRMEAERLRDLLVKLLGPAPGSSSAGIVSPAPGLSSAD